MLVPILSESLEIGSAGSDNSGAGGGSHLLKSPVGEHQNMPELICLHQFQPPGCQDGSLLLWGVFSPKPQRQAHSHPPGRRELCSTWLPRSGEGLWSGLGWFGGGLQRGVKVISQIKACCRRERTIKTLIVWWGWCEALGTHHLWVLY